MRARVHCLAGAGHGLLRSFAHHQPRCQPSGAGTAHPQVRKRQRALAGTWRQSAASQQQQHGHGWAAEHRRKVQRRAGRRDHKELVGGMAGTHSKGARCSSGCRGSPRDVRPNVVLAAAAVPRPARIDDVVDAPLAAVDRERLAVVLGPGIRVWRLLSREVAPAAGEAEGWGAAQGGAQRAGPGSSGGVVAGQAASNRKLGGGASIPTSGAPAQQLSAAPEQLRPGSTRLDSRHSGGAAAPTHV